MPHLGHPSVSYKSRERQFLRLCFSLIGHQSKRKAVIIFIIIFNHNHYNFLKFDCCINYCNMYFKLFFTDYCVGLKLDSEIRQLAVTVIGYIKWESYISQSY